MAPMHLLPRDYFDEESYATTVIIIVVVIVVVKLIVITLLVLRYRRRRAARDARERQLREQSLDMIYPANGPPVGTAVERYPLMQQEEDFSYQSKPFTETADASGRGAAAPVVTVMSHRESDPH